MPVTDVATLKALGDPLRLQILELLADHPSCTCHLVAETGARQANVSMHLRVLREAGLVESEKVGRHHYYRVRSGKLEQIGGRLSDLATRSAMAPRDSRAPCP